MRIRLKDKLNKKIVNVTVCYYSLDSGTERYVFYFFDPMYREPVAKWIYYLEDGNTEDFKNQFQQFLKENNFKVNRPSVLCMCNQETKINSIKLPKSLAFIFKHKRIIESDLKDKFGHDVKKEYFIDNKIDGFEEKNAEKAEKAARKKALIEKRKITKLEKMKESQEKEKSFVPPYKYTKFEKIANAFSLIGGYLISAFSLFVIILFLKQPVVLALSIAFIATAVVYLVGFLVLDILKHKKTKGESRKKENFLVKDVANTLLLVGSLGLVVLSEIIWIKYLSSEISNVFKNLYVVACAIFLILCVLWTNYKNKHNSMTYLTLSEFVKTFKKDSVTKIVSQEENLYFDGVTPKNLFNLSTEQHRWFKSRDDKSVISFRQLLVSQDSYKSASSTIKSLGLKVKEIRTLPSLINQFHLRYAKGVNEIVVYNEADFTLFVGIVNDKIVDSVFIKGPEKTKTKENQKTLHLQSFYNVFSSLLWSCQRESIRMNRVLFFANSDKKIEKIKDLNIFGLPYVVVPSTEALFGKESKNLKVKVKEAFTLVETVVALSIFVLVGAVVAGLLISITNINQFTKDQSKANVYVNNIREVMRTTPSNDTFEVLTTYKLGAEESEKECTYYVNYDFDVFSPSNTQGDNTYKVVAEISKVEYEGKSYSTYFFTIKSISRTSSEKNLVQEVSIEVTK